MTTKTRARLMIGLVILFTLVMNTVCVFAVSIGCMLLHVELTLGQIGAAVLASSGVWTFVGALMIESIVEYE